ncbi:lytic transglycosylase domain-containing protein [Notoacmeibacter ruber]|uniref:Lytic transglycosylase domain-containing protein n=2 Tax=Notoacmeibacter ruber TaxID=2670375 RepID=A0A3L7J2Z8_9HYPH|nr:lytic transglycosylase domain-containing protein [Notoacmeibacter ruber]
MGEAGRLERQAPQSEFSRIYGADAKQGDRSLFLFDRNAAKEKEPAAVLQAIKAASSAPEAHPTILAEIDATALRYGAHPALREAGITVRDWLRLFKANIEIESAYNPTARSHVGAIGLGQLMPDTATRLGVDPHDWRQNLDGSARYLLLMLSRFRNPQLALAAYNAGPGAVSDHKGIPPYPETQNHVVKVMAVVARLQGETS